MIAVKVALKLRSRKYNRHKVLDFNQLVNAINYFIEKQKPIHIIGYWGITDKKDVDKKDKSALHLFEQLNKRIKEIYNPGIKLTLIISDSHAIMNGYCENEFRTYISGIKELFAEYENIDYIVLSDLRAQNELMLINEIDFESHPELHKKLLLGAQKLFRGDPKLGIEIYTRTRVQESRMIEQLFPNSIFFTYNHPVYSPLFPNMPILHLYSGKGTSKPPWLK